MNMAPLLVAVHVAAGSVGLVSGAVALSTTKGRAVHPRALARNLGAGIDGDRRGGGDDVLAVPGFDRTPVNPLTGIVLSQSSGIATQAEHQLPNERRAFRFL